MARNYSFKFLKRDLNRAFIRLVKKARIDHIVAKDGLVRYSSDDEERMDNEIVSAVRKMAFPSWQVVSCPREWTGCYRAYMTRHRIPFVQEKSNDEICFLIPRKYRPHSWKIENPTSKRRFRVA